MHSGGTKGGEGSKRSGGRAAAPSAEYVEARDAALSEASASAETKIGSAASTLRAKQHGAIHWRRALTKAHKRNATLAPAHTVVTRRHVEGFCSL